MTPLSATPGLGDDWWLFAAGLPSERYVREYDCYRLVIVVVIDLVVVIVVVVETTTAVPNSTST